MGLQRVRRNWSDIVQKHRRLEVVYHSKENTVFSQYFIRYTIHIMQRQEEYFKKLQILDLNVRKEKIVPIKSIF